MSNLPRITVAEARQYDQRAMEAGIPGPVLMENAARGLADLLESLAVTGPVAIVCGKGNNGGDGFALARQLAGRHIAVEVVTAFPPDEAAETLSGDAWTAFRPLAACGIPVRDWHDDLPGLLARSQWVVDALLGTGISGAIREPFASVIRIVNEANRPVLAVDLPSGLDADTGEPGDPTIRATRTATFVAPKVGFDRPTAEPYVRTLHVVDIGANAVKADS